MKTKQIPFNLENVCYYVQWNDTNSMESDGITLVRDMGILDKKLLYGATLGPSISWLQQEKPQIGLLENLDTLLNGNEQVYIDRIPSWNIYCRDLTANEAKIVYETLKEKLLDFTPKMLAEQILPMFYK